MEPNYLANVLAKFIKELDIPVTVKSVREEIEKHPENHSMLSVSEVLNHWRIPNAAYELTYEELISAEVSQPFITYIDNEDGEFAVVRKMTSKEVVLFKEDDSQQKLTPEQFKSQYGGAVLFAEKSEDSGEEEYLTKRISEIVDEMRIPALATASLLILLGYLLMCTPFLVSFNTSIAMLMLVKSFGVAVSILLLIQSIDSDNPLVQKFCGKDNNKSCNAILSSHAAKIGGILSWSEIGFFYFAGTELVLLFNTSSYGILSLLAILNLLSLPYTIYSIYYQWKIAHQWCKLCCMIQAFLWIEFIGFLPLSIHSLRPLSQHECLNGMSGMTAPILLWMLLKPFLQQEKTMASLKEQLNQFKFNAGLFQKIHLEEVKYSLPKEEFAITIGKHDAKNVITMVSNPFCRPCFKAHKALHEWLSSRQDIKLQIIFDTSKVKNNKPAYKVISHLMNLHLENANNLAVEAVNDWYKHEQKSYISWTKKFPVSKLLSPFPIMEKQNEWCTMVDVNSTPTIFINGRKLSKLYNLEDIRYLV
jgi:uncharacterized membrane protein/glutaredoxin